MAIDPITGLPLDLLDSTAYQIPLDSQPVLAPEWNPLGKIGSTVFPDNIPTVFATAQAQNRKSPQTVQPMQTDGNGRLRVTGDSGGASVAASYADTSYFTEATLYTFDLGAVPTTLIGCTFSVMWSNYNGPDVPEHITFDLVGNNSGNVLHLARIAIRYDANPLSQGPIEFIREWPGGLDVENLFAGDTDIQVQSLPNTVAYGTLAWTLLTG